MYSGLYSATATFSCTFSYIHAYIHRGPSLDLFSRWQRVHGYTSLIRPRLHSSLHSLHSTSTFGEHFCDPGNYIRPTFYIYILRTFSYIWQCSERPELLFFVNFLDNHLYSSTMLWVNTPRTFVDFLTLALNPAMYVNIFREHFRTDSMKLLYLYFFIPFANIGRFSGPCP
jgi:hypothetical protein